VASKEKRQINTMIGDTEAVLTSHEKGLLEKDESVMTRGPKLQTAARRRATVTELA
jgi:hypothetical protein